MYRPSRTPIKGRISDIFTRKYDDIKSTIERETENHILNVNEIEYVKYLESLYIFDIPEIQFDSVTVSSHEEDIPFEYFPRIFHREESGTCKKDVIYYFIPVLGDIDLLSYSPSNVIHLSGGRNYELQGNNLLLRFINLSDNSEEISQKYWAEVTSIARNFESLKEELDRFNNTLEAHIYFEVSQRKQKFLKKNNFLSSLGVPLKQKENVPSSFSIPKPKLRKKITVAPVVIEKGFKPEPTLGFEDYNEILRLINDVGKNFERMPSVYVNKGEEDLRDHILMVLDPNFEYGSASGETFNKKGKTDIRLSYDSSVVFIAECKFWRGEKEYLKTISQLLGYLTWRDTKTSIVVFVRNKGITPILNKIDEVTQNHPNYLGVQNKTDENWFNYRFHLNDDRNREVKVAVQLYHLPNPESFAEDSITA